MEGTAHSGGGKEKKSEWKQTKRQTNEESRSVQTGRKFGRIETQTNGGIEAVGAGRREGESKKKSIESDENQSESGGMVVKCCYPCQLVAK